MYKIAFFKNNKEVLINDNEITYLKEELTIKKENPKNIITLDFKNKRCELKIEDMIFEIPIISMSFEKHPKKTFFYYTLISEPEIINTIIIYQKR